MIARFMFFYKPGVTIIWPNQDRSITYERSKHGLINYQDSKATMTKLYIMNRSLTSQIQSHTRSRGLLNDPEDDLLAKEN